MVYSHWAIAHKIDDARRKSIVNGMPTKTTYAPPIQVSAPRVNVKDPLDSFDTGQRKRWSITAFATSAWDAATHPNLLLFNQYQLDAALAFMPQQEFFANILATKLLLTDLHEKQQTCIAANEAMVKGAACSAVTACHMALVEVAAAAGLVGLALQRRADADALTTEVVELQREVMRGLTDAQQEQDIALRVSQLGAEGLKVVAGRMANAWVQVQSASQQLHELLTEELCSMISTTRPWYYQLREQLPKMLKQSVVTKEAFSTLRAILERILGNTVDHHATQMALKRHLVAFHTDTAHRMGLDAKGAAMANAYHENLLAPLHEFLRDPDLSARLFPTPGVKPACVSPPPSPRVDLSKPLLLMSGYEERADELKKKTCFERVIDRVGSFWLGVKSRSKQAAHRISGFFKVTR